jgi:RNA-binding protein
LVLFRGPTSARRYVQLRFSWAFFIRRDSDRKPIARDRAEKLLGQSGRAVYPGGMDSLNNAQIRELKARAQRMKATLRVGKDGLSPQFLAAVQQALSHAELIKIKFDYFKEDKKVLTPQLAEKTGSHLVTRVGNVVVLYRPKPAETPKA